LQRQRIHQCAEHPHLISHGAINSSLCREGFASNKVSAADNHGYLVASRANRRNLLGNVMQNDRVQTKTEITC
jgi:hypothetical protein